MPRLACATAFVVAALQFLASTPLLGQQRLENQESETKMDLLTITGVPIGTADATGPDAGRLEDRVSLFWTISYRPPTSLFRIERGGVLIGLVASTVRQYDDLTAEPDSTYEYCIYELKADNTSALIGCDDGGRKINGPTGFRASDGDFETHVAVRWSDPSQIETGFVLHRSAGNALSLDGTNDYVTAAGTLNLTNGFTFEFWASRQSTGTDDYVLNLQASPSATANRLEIGFSAANRFVVAFGNNRLETSATYTDTQWHHWAVTYNALSQRRSIYRDGTRVATDVVASPYQQMGSLEFGRHIRTGSTPNQGFFDGRLDEIRFWTVARTPTELVDGVHALVPSNAPGLGSYWPMDVSSGTAVPDVVDSSTGILQNSNNSAWVATGVGDFVRTLPPDLTVYADLTAVPGFQSYTYRLFAFQDLNGDGVFTDGVDAKSAEKADSGWRGVVTPPADVAATDGQFLDRVRVSWTDVSTTEDSYRVFRNNVQIGTTPADSMRFLDLSPLSGAANYCVASVAGGVQSVLRCDAGRAGGLAAPANVSASNGTYDDRIVVTWEDTAATESGFEVFREGVLIGSTAANATQFDDRDVPAEAGQGYCVRAFSDADPENISYSSKACAPAKGKRAVALPPSGVAASDAEFEDHIAIAWSTPSRTALLYKVYRDNVLIDVQPVGHPSSVDLVTRSDFVMKYCVSALTVADAAAAKDLQERVSYMIATARGEDAVGEVLGRAAFSPDDVLAEIQATISQDALGKTGAPADSVFESSKVCDDGSSSIHPPINVKATDDNERRVTVSWTSNSTVATGYRITRHPNPGATQFVAEVSAGITSVDDFTGTPGVVYTYEVRTVYGFWNSQPASDLGLRELIPITNLEASDGTSETIVRLDWEDNSAAEKGFRIYRKVATQGDGNYQLVGTVNPNETSFSDTVTGSLRGVDLTYKVVAFDDYGTSPGLADNGKTMIQPPRNVNASEVYVDSVTVVWTDASQIESGYRITVRRRDSPSNVFEIDSTISANSTFFSHTGTSGTTYQYCVTTVRGTGTSAHYSDTVCDDGNRFVPEGGQTASASPIRILKTTPANSRFGFSVGISGTSMLVGWPQGTAADSGSAIPFTVNLSTNAFTEGTALLNNDTSPFRRPFEDFGYAVDVSGIYAAVSTPNEVNGAVFLYKNGALHNSQIYDDIDDVGKLGESIGLADDIAIIGNPEYETDDVNEGGMAVLCSAEQTSCSATQEHLQDREGVLWVAHGRFGQAVDIAKGPTKYYAIVGQPGADLAYIFSCASSCTSRTNWSLSRRLDSPGGFGVGFGSSVAISESFALVGMTGSQEVQVYRRSGTTWSEDAILTPASSSSGFGASLDILGNNVVIGSPQESVSSHDNAGAIYTYEFDATEEAWSGPTRYDASVAGTPVANGLFGYDVAVGQGIYLAGSPGESAGAVYSIPFFYTPVNPAVEELAPAGNLTASDGTPDDRIRLRWDDLSSGEDGYYVYRSDDHGVVQRLADVGPNIEFYDDFEAAPGEAYKYCVTAYLGNTETEQRCDIGWIPPNGSIAGRLATLGGAGTRDGQVCLDPSPNRALIFDGVMGSASVDASLRLNLTHGYTIEAWIRPEDLSGTHYIVSKAGAYALLTNGTSLRFRTTANYNKSLSPGLAKGAWHHVAVVFDTDDDATFYLDGQSLGAAVTGTTASPVNGNDLFIGQLGDGSGWFEGQIDEVRIWSVERTSSEIGANWNKRLTGKEASLVGYWPLDQGKRLVAPDISDSANHATISGAVYVSDDGAPLDVCAVSDSEGNYTLSGIRYGQSTKFDVRPFQSGRNFDPDFKTITLTPASPVQNEVDFIDATAFTVAGLVQYVTKSQANRPLVCPVPDVSMHLSRDANGTPGNIKATTAEDGSYAIAVDPSRDPWYFIPEYSNPEDGAVRHTFSPANASRVVTAPIFDLGFSDTKRFTLSGNFSGGDPALCGKNIGIAKIRIYTEDGCFSDTLTVNSQTAKGAFSVSLPPLKYRIEVVDIANAPQARAADIASFFDGIGTRELDMTRGDVKLDFIYRAPLVLDIQGLEPPATCSTIDQYDEDNALVRSLQPVKVIEEDQLVPLTIRVREDYGNSQFCNVDEGTVSIYDGIGDRAEKDSVMTIRNGQVLYSTFGRSANPFGGARVEGVDRSFQKPISVISHVEGRDPLLAVGWALVEGQRARASTFVSATTDPMPLLIVHDPPGDGSSAYLSKGTSMCNSFVSMKSTGGSAGADVDLKFGVSIYQGIGIAVESGLGLQVKSKTTAGRTDGSLWDDGGDNFEVCVSSNDTWTTSSDEKYMMDDVYVGAALNLIFAIADELKVDDLTCKVSLSEKLAGGLDQAKPFATTYAYSESHIKGTLIPMLKRLIELGGNATLDGTINDEEVSVQLQEALDNWNAQLAFNKANKDYALKHVEDNKSFDGGSSISYESSYDSTYVTNYASTHITFDTDNAIGAIFKPAGWDNSILVVFEIHSEWMTEEKATEDSTSGMGYTLADDDPGDFYSVDIATDTTYRTPVFGLASGRSSNPYEVGTQPRDRAILTVDPPVRTAVPNGGPAVFTLTMTNASESTEPRLYILRSVLNSNPGGAVMIAQGTPGLHAGLPFWLPGDPAHASQEVTLAVSPGPVNLDYEGLQVQMYPEAEWGTFVNGGVGNSGIIQLADTVTFDVFFSSLGTPAPTVFLEPGWNAFSIAREGGTLDEVLADLNLSQGDMIVSDHGEARYDSASGWSGTLSHIIPGYGYKLFMKRPSIIVEKGAGINEQSPIELANGWNLIGYLPADAKPVSAALASLGDDLSPGDIIVGDEAFAQLVEGKGWIGSLTDLEPGKAYSLMIKKGGSLVYPASAPVSIQAGTIASTTDPSSQTATVSKGRTGPALAGEDESLQGTTSEKVTLKESATRPETLQPGVDGSAVEQAQSGHAERRVDGPAWSAPRDQYPASMTLVLELQKNGVPLVDPLTKIAFFSEDELRGVGSVRHVTALDKDLVFAVVYGDAEEAEDLQMRVFDASTETTFEDVGVVHYSANATVGTPLAPRTIDVLESNSVAVAGEELPTEYALGQNYPNPFNPTTMIHYALPHSGHVDLTVFDVLGRRVATLVNGELEAGRYEIELDGSQLSSGTYFYELKAGDFSSIKKMTLAK